MTVLLVLATWAGSAPCQKLEARWPGGYVVPPDRASAVTLDVLADGAPMRIVSYAGKTYLPVTRLGEEYAIRVRNHGERRVLAVVSVDGLSVINGRPATASGTGYIIDPGVSVTIKGWRRSLDTVAAFRFTGREDSYAARMGHPENVGVIGLVAYEERRRPPRRPMELRSEAGAKRADAVGGTGTGYGRDIDSRARLVPFERGRVVRSITLYYDTEAALRRAGVPVDGRSPVPFPPSYEFAPPPPGR